jgi:predicted DsbA family dithiol-disulfide isomerase
MQYYNDRFGDRKVEQMILNMKKVGQEEGIQFSYGGGVGNTLDSHRLIWKARQEGGSHLQDKVVNELFSAYFENEQSLGETTVLKECANKAGMDAAAIFQDESIGQSEVEAEMTEFASRWNCRGVPLFIVDGKYPLSGAQPKEAFLEVFDMLQK